MPRSLPQRLRRVYGTIKREPHHMLAPIRPFSLLHIDGNHLAARHKLPSTSRDTLMALRHPHLSIYYILASECIPPA